MVKQGNRIQGWPMSGKWVGRERCHGFEKNTHVNVLKRTGWLRLSSKSSFAGLPEDQDSPQHVTVQIYPCCFLSFVVLCDSCETLRNHFQDGWVLIHGAEVGREPKLFRPEGSRFGTGNSAHFHFLFCVCNLQPIVSDQQSTPT